MSGPRTRILTAAGAAAALALVAYWIGDGAGPGPPPLPLAAGGPRFTLSYPPSGKMSLAPDEAGEVCLALGAKEAVRFTFKSDHPVAFDIHYHDGTEIVYPLQIDAATEFSDRYVADLGQSYCLMWTNRAAMGTVVSYDVAGP